MEDFHERTLKQQSAVLVRKNGVSDDTGKGDQARLNISFLSVPRLFSLMLIIFKLISIQSSVSKVTGLSLSF